MTTSIITYPFFNVSIVVSAFNNISHIVNKYRNTGSLKITGHYINLYIMYEYEWTTYDDAEFFISKYSFRILIVFFIFFCSFGHC